MHLHPKTRALVDVRKAAGLSQEKLARAADCSTATVYLCEHGYRPGLAIRNRIADALDLDPAELWPETEA